MTRLVVEAAACVALVALTAWAAKKAGPASDRKVCEWAEVTHDGEEP